MGIIGPIDAFCGVGGLSEAGMAWGLVSGVAGDEMVRSATVLRISAVKFRVWDWSVVSILEGGSEKGRWGSICTCVEMEGGFAWQSDR